MLGHLSTYLIALSVLIYGSLAINPRMWLHRMPPAVRKKIAFKEERDRKQFAIVGSLMLVLMFGYPIYAILALGVSGLVSTVSYLLAFYLGFTLWDTLVLDLLIFCRFTPRFIVIEGTEACDYKDTSYHIRAGLKGTVISIVAGLVMGLIVHFLR